jgi:hypothetical protein
MGLWDQGHRLHVWASVFCQVRELFYYHASGVGGKSSSYVCGVQRKPHGRLDVAQGLILLCLLDAGSEDARE